MVKGHVFSRKEKQEKEFRDRSGLDDYDICGIIGKDKLVNQQYFLRVNFVAIQAFRSKLCPFAGAVKPYRKSFPLLNPGIFT